MAQNHRLLKKIGRYTYKFSERIGSGFSSEVFKGFDCETSNNVAIKVINTDNLKSELHNKLLNNQIEALKKLRCCDNILNLFDIIKTKNNTYIITELCSTDLNLILHKKNKLSQSEGISYFIQILTGFEILIQNGIVHRDLKPANILINQKNQIKIADFGFSIDMYELIFNKCNYQAGSLFYMAPEVLKNSEYSHKTDIWSLGVIFYQMLTGEHLWKIKDRGQYIKQICESNIQQIIEKHNFMPIINEFLVHALKKQNHLRMGIQHISKYKQKMTYILQLLTNTNCSLKPINKISSYSSLKRSNQSYQTKKTSRQKILEKQQNAQILKKRVSFYNRQSRQKTRQSSNECNNQINIKQEIDKYRDKMKQLLKKVSNRSTDSY